VLYIAHFNSTVAEICKDNFYYIEKSVFYSLYIFSNKNFNFFY
jgi:hypothetical protein